MPFFITQAAGVDERIRYSRTTRRGVYSVKDTTMSGNRLRLLLVDGVQESATYLDQEHKYEPLFQYLTEFQSAVESHPAPRRVLLIGGAGFAYPKLFFSSGQEGTLTVVEIDPRMIRLARRYFFLNDLERDYGLKQSGRLRIIEDDGLHFLDTCEEQFDVILNDAYVGNVYDQGLLSDAGVAACRKCLAPGGKLVLNIITPLAGEGAMPGIMAKTRMKEYFSSVTLYAVDATRGPAARQNCIMLCTEIS